METAIIKSLGLPEAYQLRPEPVPWNDAVETEYWQREVYIAAAAVAAATGARSVEDIGCGSGFKLLKYLGHLDTAGVETPHALTVLRERYPDRVWRDTPQGADVVICADVIEHIPDAIAFMDRLAALPFHTAILSTPDRATCRLPGDMGPPGNVSHVCEWTVPEFQAFVRQWFDIRGAWITNAEQCTQMVVVQRRGREEGSHREPMPEASGVVLHYIRPALNLSPALHTFPYIRPTSTAPP